MLHDDHAQEDRLREDWQLGDCDNGENGCPRCGRCHSVRLGSKPGTALGISCAAALAPAAMARSVPIVRHQRSAHSSLVPVVQTAKVNNLPKRLTAPNDVFLNPSLILQP